MNHQLCHVKSHQDKNIAFAKLPKDAQYNVRADELATEQLDQMRTPCTQVSFKHASYLKILDRYITSKPIQALREAAQIQTQIPYLCDKFKWTQTVFDDIDWEVHSKALHSFSRQDRFCLIKFIHDWLPTGKRRHRETKGTYPQC